MLSSIGVSHPTLDDVCLTLRKVGLTGKLTGAGGGGFALALVPPSLPEKTLVQAVDLLEAKGLLLGIRIHFHIFKFYFCQFEALLIDYGLDIPRNNESIILLPMVTLLFL